MKKNAILDFFVSIPLGVLFRVNLLAFVQTLQWLIIIGYVLFLFPTTSQIQFLPPLIDNPFYCHPGRDPDIYRMGVILFFLINAALLALLRKRIKENQFLRFFDLWIIVEFIVLLLLWGSLNVIQIGVIYNNNIIQAQPNGQFFLFIGLSIIGKALLIRMTQFESKFWFRSSAMFKSPKAGIKKGLSSIGWSWAWLVCSLAIFCVLALMITDMKAVADFAYIGERQVQNTFFMSGAAYWFFKGGLPAVDGWSVYGVGIPIIVGGICKFLGQFNFETIYWITLCTTIIYCTAWIPLFLRWTCSPLLTIAWTFFLLNFRAFGDEGGAFNAYITLSATPIRFFLDVFFMTTVTCHWINRKPLWLIVTCALAGTQLFLNFFSGIALMFVLGVYLILYTTIARRTSPHQIKMMRHVGIGMGIALLTYMVWMICFYHSYLGQGYFWKNYLQQFEYFKNGMWAGPHLETLQKHPWTVWLSGLYLISALPAVSLVLRNGFSDVRPLILSLMSFYGIYDYQHFVIISGLNVMLRNIPIALTLFLLWTDMFLERIPLAFQRIIKIILVFSAAFILLHNPKWKDYPNIFHPQTQMSPTASNEELKKYFDEHYSFSDDAAMIQSLTSPDDRVPVISEHEMLILIQSNRKPFFYIFPLIVPQQIENNLWPMDELCSYEMLFKTLDMINLQKPSVIFISKKLWQNPIPSSYVHQYFGIYNIIKEVRKSYVPFQESPYLIALKLK